MRRYAPLRPSAGTVIPLAIRRAVYERDEAYCVCDRARFPAEVRARCSRSPVELDHVRSSGAMGKKSATTVDNLVCTSNECHRWKTENGRIARPLLLAYIARATDPHEAHVDPVAGCEACYAAVAR